MKLKLLVSELKRTSGDPAVAAHLVSTLDEEHGLENMIRTAMSEVDNEVSAFLWWIAAWSRRVQEMVGVRDMPSEARGH
ncbi:MAG: hypothetical protein H6726_23705 [Sandaracinaceae bacterium]|nr:hypothetical protein [Myxococcales bacterium]MCB9660671.1 hypothetical protein [Sandaracinaceae bacterium]